MTNPYREIDSDVDREILGARRCSGSRIRILTMMAVLCFAAGTLTPLAQAASDIAFGRLFTTPEERKALDKDRPRGGVVRAQQSGIEQHLGSDTVEGSRNDSQPIKLAGVLLRADGQHQVWVSGGNGQRENPDFAREILGDIVRSAQVKVPLHGAGREAILKPGQVWLPNSQRVEESYRWFTPKPTPATQTSDKISEREKALVEPKNVGTQSEAAKNEAMKSAVSSVGFAEVSSSAQSNAK